MAGPLSQVAKIFPRIKAMADIAALKARNAQRWAKVTVTRDATAQPPRHGHRQSPQR